MFDSDLITQFPRWFFQTNYFKEIFLHLDFQYADVHFKFLKRFYILLTEKIDQ